MSEFRIEKIQQPLKITLTSGERLAGIVFLEPMARNHAGPQEPRELLNEPEAFFPFSVGGRVLLLAKDLV
jgi:hypothetical protein